MLSKLEGGAGAARTENPDLPAGELGPDLAVLSCGRAPSPDLAVLSCGRAPSPAQRSVNEGLGLGEKQSSELISFRVQNKAKGEEGCMHAATGFRQSSPSHPPMYQGR